MAHVEDHLFQGVCICSCKDCTKHIGKDKIQCTCRACDSLACGLR